jgi:hypothetical protein
LVTELYGLREILLRIYLFFLQLAGDGRSGAFDSSYRISGNRRKSSYEIQNEIQKTS